MSYYDDELDGIAKSIDIDLNKLSYIRNFSRVGVIFCMILFFYIINTYGPTNPAPVSLVTFMFILFMISFMGFSYADNRRTKVFKNMKETLFYYLFCTWKYHNEEKSKKYLKDCIDELDTYLNDYKNLAYTEDIYLTFNSLRDILIHNIYPKLGARGASEGEIDLTKQTSAWNEFKSLSTDIYQNIPIISINARISTLNKSFESNPTIKLDVENRIIKTVKTITAWNVENYKNSLFYRFLFFSLFTIIIDYFAIKNQLATNEIIIPATVLIPIMAPYYLASKQK